MAQLIGYDTFRTLRACRRIEATNAEILGRLEQMRSDTRRTRDSLEEAGRRLEQTLDHFSTAQRKLGEANDQHRRVMRVIDEIMDNSPAFAFLR